MEEINIKLTGMNLDSSPSITLNSQAFENMNIRFSGTNEGNDTLSITNEKGTYELRMFDLRNMRSEYFYIPGTVLGYAIVLKYLVIFSTYEDEDAVPVGGYKDHIIILEKLDDIEALRLKGHCLGNFNFNVTNPIETLVNIEREDILKVYWIDGLNPLRMIIVNEFISNNNFELEDSEYFDNIRLISSPIITIEKLNSGGTFPTGVIQYACTYYSTFKGESNICYLSPLNYLSQEDKGLSADKTSDCSFKINILTIDESYEYLRIYSIIMTEINGTPQVSLIDELSTKDICDNKTSGDTYTKTIEVTKYNKYYTPKPTTVPLRLTFKKINADGTEALSETINYGDYSWKLYFYYSITESQTFKILEHLYSGDEVVYTYTISEEEKLNNNITIEFLPLLNAFLYKVIVSYKKTYTTPDVYTYYDSGEYKQTIESSKLLYVGGERFIPKCLAQKDDTLFLGNYYLIRADTPNITLDQEAFSFEYNKEIITCDTGLVYYSYIGQLEKDNSLITTFKAGETYRFGVLFQDKYGRWSSPMWLGKDYNLDKYPKILLSGASTIQDITELAIGKYTIDKTIVNEVLNLGFIKVRPLVVFPKEGELEVLFQGVANCTLKKGLYNYDYNYNTCYTAINPSYFKEDYNLSSWFFRPVVKDASELATNPTEYGKHLDYNCAPLLYLHWYVVPLYWSSTSSEDDYSVNSVKAEFQYTTQDFFVIDWGTITIDSPDLLFNEQLSVKNLDDSKIRIIGYTEPAASVSSYYIDIDGSCETLEAYKDVLETKESDGNYTKSSSLPFGKNLIFNNVIKKYLNLGDTTVWNYGSTLINLAIWVDAFSDSGPAGHDKYFASWYVFPWNRTGALNNCSKANVGNLGVMPETLKKKTIATLKYTRNTQYLDSFISALPEDTTLSKNDIKVFLLKSELLTCRFKDQTLYRNTMDLVEPASGLPPYCNLSYVKKASDSYSWTPLKMTLDLDDNKKPKTGASYSPLTSIETKNLIGTGKYNNTAYDGLSTINSGDADTILEYFRCNLAIPILFKTGNNCVVHLPDNTNLLLYFSGYYGFPIVEIYKDTPKNKFGGTSLTALENNEWLIAGEDIVLIKDSDAILYYTEGDTYYQRYDCLKTLPYSDTSINNIIEILSFMCETKINIDGRYDNNRGLEDNTNITTENFNLINNTYTLNNNYFISTITPSTEASVNSYPNLIIWSLTKTLGDKIDAWLNNSLTSYINLDGDKGSVNSIKLFKDNLVVFLDSGISLLKYNQNVIVNGTTGVPIEIANSGKVTGALYLETNSGTTNKWAIAETQDSLIYVDTYNKALKALVPGLATLNLSDMAGMRSWFHNNINSIDSWDPKFSNDTYKLLYSKKNDEVLLISADYCLAYNFYILSFTSFYSYNNIPWLVNLNGLEFFLNTDTVTGLKSDYEYDDEGNLVYEDYTYTQTTPWLLNGGDYDSFFGTTLPYYTKLIINLSDKFNIMKVFDVLEIRDNLALTLNTDKTILKKPFDSIKAWNSYLESLETDLASTFKHSHLNLKSKFRVWRINIPRLGRLRMRDHYLEVWLKSLGHGYKTLIEGIRALYT